MLLSFNVYITVALENWSPTELGSVHIHTVSAQNSLQSTTLFSQPTSKSNEHPDSDYKVRKGQGNGEEAGI